MKIFKIFFLENESSTREEIRCNTGQALEHERVPRPHRPESYGTPNKSFIIIGLTEINTAPEGQTPFGFRLDTGFQEYLGNTRVWSEFADCRLFHNATNNANAGNILVINCL
jgi:hypothetical protein